MSTFKLYIKFMGIAIAFLLFPAIAGAQANSALLPNPKIPFLDVSGNPISGGLVYFYAAGTTTPLATYSDSLLTVQNTNPVVLDSAGRASIYLLPQAYKVVVQTAMGGAVYTQDNVFEVGQILRANLGASTGAGLIGYQPPNSGTPLPLSNLANGVDMGSMLGYQLTGSMPFTVAAGSVPRTLAQKLAEWVSLADFGAKCDGVTDDKLAIIAAIGYANATPAHTIWVPPTGHLCMTSGSIDVGTAGNGIIFRGQSSGNSGVSALAGGSYSTYTDGSVGVTKTYLMSIGGGNCTVAVPYTQVRDMTAGGANAVDTVLVNACGEENSGYSNMLVGGGNYANLYNGYNAINSHDEDLTFYPNPGTYGIINLGITRNRFSDLTINGGGTSAAGILQLGNARLSDFHCEHVALCVDSVANTLIENIDCSPGVSIATACVNIRATSATMINQLTGNGVYGPMIADAHRTAGVLNGYGITFYWSTGLLLMTSDPTIPWILPSSIQNVPGGIGFAGPLNIDGHELLGDWGNGAYLQITNGSPQGLIIQSNAIATPGRTGGLDLNGVGYAGDPSFGSVMAGATYDGGTGTPMGTAASGMICSGGSCNFVANTGLTSAFYPTAIANISPSGFKLPAQAAASGMRYACIDTTGKIVSSPTACSGT